MKMTKKLGLSVVAVLLLAAAPAFFGDIFRLGALPTSSLPAAAASNLGGLVFNTTTSTVQVSTGSAWVDVQGGSTGPWVTTNGGRNALLSNDGGTDIQTPLLSVIGNSGTIVLPDGGTSLNNGLVRYYPLKTNALDYIGSQHGTAVTAAGAGFTGSGFDPAYTASYVLLPAFDGIALDGGYEFTIAVRYTPAVGPTGFRRFGSPVIGQYDSSTSNPSTNDFEVYISSSDATNPNLTGRFGGFSSTYNLNGGSLGAPSQYVMTVQGNVVRAFSNNGLATNNSFPLPHKNKPIFVGAYPVWSDYASWVFGGDTQYPNGTFYDVMFWNRKLSDAEVNDLWNGSTPTMFNVTGGNLTTQALTVSSTASAATLQLQAQSTADIAAVCLGHSSSVGYAFYDTTVKKLASCEDDGGVVYLW